MDDDLLLNIAEGGPSTKRTPSSTRKRGSQARSTRPRATAPDTQSRPKRPASSENPRPSKRPRHAATPLEQRRSTNDGKPQPRTIISSLFTSNPRITPRENSGLPRGNSHPSNAPLREGLSFEELGLNPLLASHLRRKMDIQEPTAIQREAIRVLLASSSNQEQRDVFIQSQTGSGKTLAFLLPILHDLLPLGELSFANRGVGTLAIVISPTRELARQTSSVLENLLSLRLQHSGGETGDPELPRQTRWIVSGLLSGGSTRSHEKARIRKGLPIVVATPGRLLDHIQHTASFDTSKCRWLVLDEADTLMELGFFETIRSILRGLDGRRNLAVQATDANRDSASLLGLERPRRTILCSATLRDDVKSLAGDVLRDPVIIQISANGDRDEHNAASSERLSMPSQLTHKYAVVPLKLRLITLVALIRASLASCKVNGDHTRLMVFCSCTDIVDFLYVLFTGAALSNSGPSMSSTASMSANFDAGHQLGRTSEMFPEALVYRLHGSMDDTKRQESFKDFVINSGPSIMLCTSVASRGLDMPHLSTVVQYDLPTENGIEEYIHRVGRTARMGQKGEAWSFVSPEEKDWVGWLESGLQQRFGREQTQPQLLWSVAFDEILRSGLGGEYQRRATQLQLAFERSAITNPEICELAKRAFKSFVRAYATHPVEEKHIFHIRKLHLGHLAKSFALRETPSQLGKSRKSVAYNPDQR